MEKDKFKWWSILLIVMFFAVGSWAVRAEDDEREEEDEEHQEDREDEKAEDKSSTETDAKVAQTTTSQSVETVILKDGDGDGILDKDDAHPTVAEIYIVKDDDKNGIVDSFEK
jgi:hypothetical protein